MNTEYNFTIPLSSTKQLPFTSSTRENHGGHKFKDNCEAESAVTQWLMIHDTDFCCKGT